MVEEVEHLIPIKYSIKYVQNIASDSQVQLVAFTWQNCLEQTGGEWAKGEKLTPSSQCSG